MEEREHHRGSSSEMEYVSEADQLLVKLEVETVSKYISVTLPELFGS